MAGFRMDITEIGVRLGNQGVDNVEISK